MKISIMNEKGGVGKTTTTSSLGSILAQRGYKVVMIDLDPQNDLTLSCPIDEITTNIFDCLFEHNRIQAINVNPRLVIIPGSAKMGPLEFSNQVQRHPQYKLRNHREILRIFLQKLDNQCDFILFDCPPNQDLIVQNAMTASDFVLIPTVPHSFSLNGINSVLSLINEYKAINSALEPLGILMNNYDQRNKIDQAVYELCIEEYGSLLFNTPIRINTKLKENTHLGVEIIEYAKELEQKKIPQKFSGYDDFMAVTDELLERLKVMQP